MGISPVERKKQLVFSICGYKKTGKTTLVSGICEILTQKGYRVAVIKHDGHDFEGDVPGTDSWKHMKAGAYGTAVFSPHRFLIHKTCPDPQISLLIGMFPEADIILIEGLKDEDFPKYICSDPAASTREIPALAARIEQSYLDL